MKKALWIVIAILTMSMASASVSLPSCEDVTVVDDCHLDWRGWNIVIECDDTTVSHCEAGVLVYSTSEIDGLADDFESMVNDLDNDLASVQEQVDDNTFDIRRNSNKISDLYRKYKSLKRELDNFEHYSYHNFHKLYMMFGFLDRRVDYLDARIGSLEDFTSEIDDRLTHQEGRGSGIDSERAASICREIIADEVTPLIDELDGRVGFVEKVVNHFHNSYGVSVGKFFTLLKSKWSGQPEMFGDSKCFGYITPWYCISR